HKHTASFFFSKTKKQNNILKIVNKTKKKKRGGGGKKKKKKRPAQLGAGPKGLTAGRRGAPGAALGIFAAAQRAAPPERP
ncbi:hypothetical protein, partial [Klebsiella pneumoniae]|uniref:hypothetical protein n=1 Tax=Klebsiella pneumoniae TaxID=573 RepID=UPI001ADEE9B5